MFVCAMTGSARYVDIDIKRTGEKQGGSMAGDLNLDDGSERMT